jgi:hypothetical protein
MRFFTSCEFLSHALLFVAGGLVYFVISRLPRRNKQRSPRMPSALSSAYDRLGRKNAKPQQYDEPR